VREEILTGIAQGEFHVLYQPQMMADGSRMVAVEALVRWNSPVRGPVGPADFIASAESENVIKELGAFVLRQACQDALNWPHLVVSVNVSALQLQDPQFVAFVEATLQETGLPPTRLELEIVESALIENFELADEALTRLRRQGVRIALDDFGTGYSSLTYLRKFPLDKLKIDRSFVRDSGMVMSASIIQAIAALARALGLKITAEGVETEAQKTFLRVCGCHYLQGYLFSKPVSALSITRMLAESQAKRRAG
jgi:EAL domain-containing protein (putative c-di-GMP-specific phosphodiesterase class I)